MWKVCFNISFYVAVLAAVLAIGASVLNITKAKRFKPLIILLGGLFFSAAFMFFPIHRSVLGDSAGDVCQAFCLSAFNAMQVLGLGCEYGVVEEGIQYCTEELLSKYKFWISFLYFLTPIFTFSFVLSFFKNICAHFGYWIKFYNKVYIFSELNEQSITLAQDIRKNNFWCGIFFTDVFEEQIPSRFCYGG